MGKHSDLAAAVNKRARSPSTRAAECILPDGVADEGHSVDGAFPAQNDGDNAKPGLLWVVNDDEGGDDDEDGGGERGPVGGSTSQ